MGYNFLLQKQICVCLIDFHRDIRLEVWMFVNFQREISNRIDIKTWLLWEILDVTHGSCMMVVVAKIILSIHHESSQHNKLSI